MSAVSDTQALFDGVVATVVSSGILTLISIKVGNCATLHLVLRAVAVCNFNYNRAFTARRKFDT